MTASATVTPKPPEKSDRELVLSVEGVSKKFCRNLKQSLAYGLVDLASELVGWQGKEKRLRSGEFWALDNVSLELRRGEALGLVGPNGSGKTTLLRAIAGLIKPDKGRIRVKGRIAPLLAAGVGFDPVLTGRENIYANMAILGLSKQEIDDRFEEVVAFAEIPEAIDAPVRSYSSGMRARLGFACAIYVEPDILLVDEVLAVGDIKFRSKCTHKLHRLRESGMSVLLVNHSSLAILSLCERAVFLGKGKVVAAGATDSVMAHYEEALFSVPTERQEGKIIIEAKKPEESLGCDITSVCFADEFEREVIYPSPGQKLLLKVGFYAHRPLEDINLILFITELARESAPILTLSNVFDRETMRVGIGAHEIRLEFPCFSMRPSRYNLRVDIRENNLSHLDSIENFTFVVKPNRRADTTRSEFYQPRRWKLAE